MLGAGIDEVLPGGWGSLLSVSLWSFHLLNTLPVRSMYKRKKEMKDTMHMCTYIFICKRRASSPAPKRTCVRYTSHTAIHAKLHAP